jgi:hypothetical protein
MSGNVWEWCQDLFTRELENIPQDGAAFVGPGDERVLRGGCFHNWAVHCTVSKRYEIGHDYHDGASDFGSSSRLSETGERTEPVVYCTSSWNLHRGAARSKTKACGGRCRCPRGAD